MKALPWQGNTNVEVLDVPDPAIEEATDVIITVTSTAVCGSDLHLYGVLGAYLKRGDILGREAVGGVAEVGPVVEGLDVGDRVVSRSTSPAGAAGCVSVSCTYGARRRRCVAREMSGTSGRHLLRVGARRAGRVSARSSRLSSGRSRSRTARRPSTSATCPTSCQAVRYADVSPGGSCTTPTRCPCETRQAPNAIVLTTARSPTSRSSSTDSRSPRRAQQPVRDESARFAARKLVPVSDPIRAPVRKDAPGQTGQVIHRWCS
jgi:hypothetical protein